MYSVYVVIGAPLQVSSDVRERRAIIGEIISSHFEEKAGITCTSKGIKLH